MGVCQSSKNKPKKKNVNHTKTKPHDVHKQQSTDSVQIKRNKSTQLPTVNNNNALSTECSLPEIKNSFQDGMETLLTEKTSKQLITECTNCIANGKNIDFIYANCGSIKRVRCMLKEYVKLIQCISLSKQMCLSEIFTFKDKYTLVQITNDFYHIKDHMDHDKSVAKELARKFRDEFNCTDGIRIRGRGFSCKPFTESADSTFNDEIDKILSCLTHVEIGDTYTPSIKHHVGKKEDDKWWEYDIDDEMKQQEMDEDIYCHLVVNMNIFRWQSTHGFNSKQHQSLMHLKPKYKNIKEEALNNAYYKLSKDNWNQTLRKAKVFYNSFARQRIQTVYNGKYDDKITQKITTWKQGETIDMAEIVTFKLYTDYDKLQYELKKCFRFESMKDVFTLNNFDPEAKLKYGYVFENNEKEIGRELEQRLSIFYWWRIKLMTTLNKYSKELNPKIALYHGVNGKMILNGRNSSAFCGPLSTSSSYHVARTFATAKGMVLEVTTQYPRLGLCRAFDVSWISDYPEEKEQLVSFAYVRITKVFTRALNKNWKTFDDMDNDKNEYNIPLSSITRAIFFAVHLFRQHIFSMSVHCEYWVSAFLYIHCNYNELDDNKDNGHISKTKFVDQLKKIITNTEYNIRGESMEDWNRYRRILSILSNKFDNFRKYPNRNQVIKMDRISENLKAYFMDYVNLDIYKKEQYTVSISKIIKIFPNAKEIHFINDYSFDDVILNRLIQYVEANPKSKLKKIKFLFYDYPIVSQNGNDKYLDEKRFFDPEKLDETLKKKMQEMNWKIVAKEVGSTGYEIKLFSNNSQTHIPWVRLPDKNIVPDCVNDKTMDDCGVSSDVDSSMLLDQHVITNCSRVSSNSETWIPLLCVVLYVMFCCLLLVHQSIAVTILMRRNMDMPQSQPFFIFLIIIYTTE